MRRGPSRVPGSFRLELLPLRVYSGSGFVVYYCFRIFRMPLKSPSFIVVSHRMFSSYKFFSAKPSPEAFHEALLKRLSIFHKCLEFNSLRACAYQDVLNFTPVCRDKPVMVNINFSVDAARGYRTLDHPNSYPTLTLWVKTV